MRGQTGIARDSESCYALGVAVEYEFIHDGTGCVIRGHGSVNLEQLSRAGSAVVQPHVLEELRYIYSDYAGITDLDLDPEQVRELAALFVDAPMRNSTLCMATVASGPLVYGMNRMFDLTAELTWVIQLFETTAEAVDWLARRFPDLSFDDLRQPQR